eukprot:Rmarinus@m.13108
MPCDARRDKWDVLVKYTGREDPVSSLRRFDPKFIREPHTPSTHFFPVNVHSLLDKASAAHELHQFKDSIDLYVEASWILFADKSLVSTEMALYQAAICIAVADVCYTQCAWKKVHEWSGTALALLFDPPPRATWPLITPAALRVSDSAGPTPTPPPSSTAKARVALLRSRSSTELSLARTSRKTSANTMASSRRLYSLLGRTRALPVPEGDARLSVGIGSLGYDWQSDLREWDEDKEAELCAAFLSSSAYALRGLAFASAPLEVPTPYQPPKPASAPESDPPGPVEDFPPETPEPPLESATLRKGFRRQCFSQSAREPRHTPSTPTATPLSSTSRLLRPLPRPKPDSLSQSLPRPPPHQRLVSSTRPSSRSPSLTQSNTHQSLDPQHPAPSGPDSSRTSRRRVTFGSPREHTIVEKRSLNDDNSRSPSTAGSKAVKLQKQTPHPEEDSTAHTEDMNLRDVPAALQCFVKALDLRERLFGKDHPCWAVAVNNVAGCHVLSHRFVRAICLYREADGCLAGSLGPQQHHRMIIRANERRTQRWNPGITDKKVKLDEPLLSGEAFTGPIGVYEASSKQQAHKKGKAGNLNLQRPTGLSEAESLARQAQDLDTQTPRDRETFRRGEPTLQQRMERAKLHPPPGSGVRDDRNATPTKDTTSYETKSCTQALALGVMRWMMDNEVKVYFPKPKKSVNDEKPQSRNRLYHPASRILRGRRRKTEQIVVPKKRMSAYWGIELALGGHKERENPHPLHFRVIGSAGGQHFEPRSASPPPEVFESASGRRRAAASHSDIGVGQNERAFLTRMTSTPLPVPHSHPPVPRLDLTRAQAAIPLSARQISSLEDIDGPRTLGGPRSVPRLAVTPRVLQGPGATRSTRERVDATPALLIKTFRFQSGLYVNLVQARRMVSVYVRRRLRALGAASDTVFAPPLHTIDPAVFPGGAGMGEDCNLLSTPRPKEESAAAIAMELDRFVHAMTVVDASACSKFEYSSAREAAESQDWSTPRHAKAWYTIRDELQHKLDAFLERYEAITSVYEFRILQWQFARASEGLPLGFEPIPKSHDLCQCSSWCGETVVRCVWWKRPCWRCRMTYLSRRRRRTEALRASVTSSPATHTVLLLRDRYSADAVITPDEDLPLEYNINCLCPLGDDEAMYLDWPKRQWKNPARRYGGRFNDDQLYRPLPVRLAELHDFHKKLMNDKRYFFGKQMNVLGLINRVRMRAKPAVKRVEERGQRKSTPTKKSRAAGGRAYAPSTPERPGNSPGGYVNASSARASPGHTSSRHGHGRNRRGKTTPTRKQRRGPGVSIKDIERLEAEEGREAPSSNSCSKQLSIHTMRRPICDLAFMNLLSNPDPRLLNKYLRVVMKSSDALAVLTGPCQVRRWGKRENFE